MGIVVLLVAPLVLQEVACPFEDEDCVGTFFIHFFKTSWPRVDGKCSTLQISTKNCVSMVTCFSNIYIELPLYQSLLLNYRITGNLPLISLSFYLITRVGDEALVAIGEGCSLHHLNVSGCHQIGDAGIIAIARGCPELSYLDVSVLQVCPLILALFIVEQTLYMMHRRYEYAYQVYWIITLVALLISVGRA